MAEINKKAIKDIGLTENETEVYLTLLKLGPSPVSEIASNSKLYRPYVYDNLKKLMEKGFVSSNSREDKKYFQAVNPKRLLEYLKDKEKALENVMPDLLNLISIPKEETKIELYKGKEVMKIVQKDVIKTLKNLKSNQDKESLVIGVDEKKFKEIDEIAISKFFIEMKENKFKEKVLVRKGDTYLPGKKGTTKYKFISKDFFTPTSTFIYGNKVSIIIFGQPLYGLIIESKLLSESYRKQFYLIWKQAKK